VLYFFRGQSALAKSYLWRGAGLLRGYFFGPSDLKKARTLAD